MMSEKPSVEAPPRPYERAVLGNGLRVLTTPLPHTHSVSISFYVGTGSRYERPDEAGISHFVEHMLFKGSAKRPTAKEIAEAIDSVGGILNGGTDREYTVYYIKVARPHVRLALDLLSDLVRNPLMDAGELEKERRVVLEELAMVEDSPAQLADLLLDSILWPDNPLGRDVAGTPESVAGITRDEMLDYLRRQYVPNNMVISIAGAISHEEVLAPVEAALRDWPGGQPTPWQPVSCLGSQRWALRHKPTEQAHISLAAPGLPLNHPDRYALSFLSVILGEGMSSRLFMELREKRGLVYDVHTYVSQFLDTGAFNIYTGVDPQKAVEALRVIIEEVARLHAHGPTEEELEKARELSKGRLLLRMEDTRNVSGWAGGQELLLGTVRSVEEAVAEMEAVTPADLRRLAKEILDPTRFYLAVVGPFKSARRFADILPG